MATLWPCDIGNANAAQYHPSRDLFAIINQANTSQPVQAAVVISAACACALNHVPAYGTGTATEHCEWVRLARNRADAGDWPGCINALQHTGPKSSSVPTPASAYAWPCDHGAATGDPTTDLFKTIQRANNWAGSMAANVIFHACQCASTHDKKVAGTYYDTEQKHVDWCSLAWTRALSGSWSLCIDALDHVGGGGDDEDGLTVTVRGVVTEFVSWLRDAQRFELLWDKLRVLPPLSGGPKPGPDPVPYPRKAGKGRAPQDEG